MIVKQVVNVIELLEYFMQRKSPATLTEISQEMGWPRSSTFNLVSTLTDKGYLYEPQIRKGYYPSPRWLSVSQTIVEADPLPESTQDLVNEIVKESGETTAICAPAGTFAVLNYVKESAHSVRYFANVGTRVPIYASSAGRALLAQYTEKERLQLFRKIPFKQFTDKTPISIDTVEEELRRAKQRGFHQSNSEFIPDLIGVAIPLQLPHRRLSIVVAGPVSRCQNKEAEFARIMKNAVTRFADDFGQDIPSADYP